MRESLTFRVGRLSAHYGDAIYGDRVQKRILSLGINEVVTAPASPWQNAYVERVIGSLRRELLEHIVILNERHLKRLLSSYLDYYHPWNAPIIGAGCAEWSTDSPG